MTDIVERLKDPGFMVPPDMPAKDKLLALIHGLEKLCHEAAGDIERLRSGIQDYLDGNYGRDQHFKTKHDKCPHNLFGWESCENCIDAYFTALLKNET